MGNKRLKLGCIIGIIIAFLLVVGLSMAVYVLFSWRTMIVKEAAVDNAWAQVQIVYQRRLDLVDNLANSARGYMQLEKDIFEAITDARTGIQNAETLSDLDNANESTSQALSSFIDDFNVVVEDTPEIKSSEVVGDLMVQLEGSENRIAVERSRFNKAVKKYNVYIKIPPCHIIANWFGFTEKEFFEA
ncbi:MAG TPA: LemA family protein, partial [Actinobacteria bacterium]|nr:LemA family protein [Actinomycetota bacterium]